MGSRGSRYEEEETAENQTGLSKRDKKRAKELAETVLEYQYTYAAPNALTKEQMKDYLVNQYAAGQALKELAEMTNKLTDGAAYVLLHPMGVPEKDIFRAMKKVEETLGVRITGSKEE